MLIYCSYWRMTLLYPWQINQPLHKTVTWLNLPLYEWCSHRCRFTIISYLLTQNDSMCISGKDLSICLPSLQAHPLCFTSSAPLSLWSWQSGWGFFHCPLWSCKLPLQREREEGGGWGILSHVPSDRKNSTVCWGRGVCLFLCVCWFKVLKRN